MLVARVPVGHEVLYRYRYWVGQVNAGGVFNKHKLYDGHKFVCLDNIPLGDPNCLIYSFGLNREWSYEEHMQSRGWPFTKFVFVYCT